MFCAKCGNSLPEGSGFCPNCGYQVNVSRQESRRNDQQELYNLSITREKQWVFINPAIKVLINGTDNYELEKDSTLKLRLPRGQYQIEFSTSIRKTMVSVSLNCDTTLTVNWNRVTGAINVK